MDAHQTTTSAKPYDGPSQYAMSGGNGFAGPEEPSSSRPWDRPSSYPDPVSGSGAYPQGSSELPPTSRPYDPSPRPNGSTTKPYDPSKPYDTPAKPYDTPAKPYDTPAKPYDTSKPYDPSPKPYGPAAEPYDPSTKPYDPSLYPTPTGPVGPSVEQMPGPAAMSYSSQYDGTAGAPLLAQQQTGLSAPMVTSPQDIRYVRGQTLEALGELYTLQKNRQRLGGTPVPLELEQQYRMQLNKASFDLRTLREEVKILISDAEKHRWRKWLIGSIVATIIPTVNFIFRRSPSEKKEDKSVTDTEHSFVRTRALLAKIKDTVLGRNSIASIAFFVFAVLYVFSNEVTLLVAKTVNKRLKKLSSRIEKGDGLLEEKDLKLLDGWRWRVLLLGQ
ncbi:hypothetical protein VD0001_g3657 [Verticillium dahliae]|uniref:Uncharacterized protein n=1 Tax=Verticillium dahliae TaxID=27337 RepID=A0A444RMC5_VERDA|nr:hypothetical protein VD0001_g3657 [Verticillium dahliae]RXG42235.1 hypothetical protein VDGE_08082 [Verticillium dahliae]